MECVKRIQQAVSDFSRPILLVLRDAEEESGHHSRVLEDFYKIDTYICLPWQRIHYFPNLH